MALPLFLLPKLPPSTLPPIQKKMTFYIVFHRDVLPENTQEYTPEEIRERFLWVAVNDSIPKIIPRDLPFIEERSFRRYTPELQQKKYYQNSVFFHLYWNAYSLTSEYMGFGQYDMEIQKEGFEKTLELLDKPNVVVSFLPHPFIGCPHVYSPELWYQMFLRPYNAFRNKRHTFSDLAKYPLCLWHTFIIPRWLFVEMMEFVDWNMRNLQMRTNDTINRHLAGTLERVFAFYISCVMHEGRVEFHKGEGMIHHDEQRIADPFRSMSGRP